jgi:hypothetical protein
MEIQKRSADSSPHSIDDVVMAARKKFPARPRPPGAAVAIDSDAGARHIFGAFGVHWKIDSADSGGRDDSEWEAATDARRLVAWVRESAPGPVHFITLVFPAADLDAVSLAHVAD